MRRGNRNKSLNINIQLLEEFLTVIKKTIKPDDVLYSIESLKNSQINDCFRIHLGKLIKGKLTVLTFQS